jgi:DNA-binding transcriptional ArsR family regulator
MARHELRDLTDPRTMRALTHPVRLSLLEELAHAGSLTATEAAEAIGETPTTCSFHLRQLAKYGFVEEAGGGAGRRRPWRLAHVGMRFSDVQDDPEASRAAVGLQRFLRERHLARAATALEQRATYPPEWREHTGQSQFLLHLTADELKAIDEEVAAVLMRYQDRVADPAERPADSKPIEVLLFSYLLDRES